MCAESYNVPTIPDKTSATLCKFSKFVYLSEYFPPRPLLSMLLRCLKQWLTNLKTFNIVSGGRGGGTL